MNSFAQAMKVIEANARAPGKIILAGEHFVVLGTPAIAMAINLYSKVGAKPRAKAGVEIDVDLPLKFLTQTEQTRHSDSENLLKPLRLAAQSTLDHIGKKRSGVAINVNCEIPVGAGLGSSASTTVAIVSAVSKSQGVELSRREIFQLAFVSERFLHGKPSGVDQATCIHGGLIQFIRPSTVNPITIEDGPVFLLCDTGVHHATGSLVGSVVKKSRREKKNFQDHMAHAREISRGVLKALKMGNDDELGSLMSENHELLRKIGVSHPKLDQLVKAAQRAGALGAKLTGAGGGGCIIVVCKNREARQTIARRLRGEGGIPFNISQDSRGLQVATA